MGRNIYFYIISNLRHNIDVHCNLFRIFTGTISNNVLFQISGHGDFILKQNHSFNKLQQIRTDEYSNSSNSNSLLNNLLQ